MVSKDRMYSSFSGLPRVLLALLLVLRFPGEKATEPLAGGAPPRAKRQLAHPTPSPLGLGCWARGRGVLRGSGAAVPSGAAGSSLATPGG